MGHSPPICTTGCRRTRPIPPVRERGYDVVLPDGRFLELNRARLGLRSLRLSASTRDAPCAAPPDPTASATWSMWVSRAALKALSRGVSRFDIVTLEPLTGELGGGCRNLHRLGFKS